VQGFASSQSSGAPALQVPPPQLSPTVHGLPSLQLPSTGWSTQPLWLSHAGSLQRPRSGQINGFPEQFPWMSHNSPWVHASPSSQSPLSTVVHVS
jgi:hypothetical protein